MRDEVVVAPGVTGIRGTDGKNVSDIFRHCMSMSEGEKLLVERRRSHRCQSQCPVLLVKVSGSLFYSTSSRRKATIKPVATLSRSLTEALLNEQRLELDN